MRIEDLIPRIPTLEERINLIEVLKRYKNRGYTTGLPEEGKEKLWINPETGEHYDWTSSPTYQSDAHNYIISPSGNISYDIVTDTDLGLFTILDYTPEDFKSYIDENRVSVVEEDETLAIVEIKGSKIKWYYAKKQHQLFPEKTLAAGYSYEELMDPEKDIVGKETRKALGIVEVPKQQLIISSAALNLAIEEIVENYHYEQGYPMDEVEEATLIAAKEGVDEGLKALKRKVIEGSHFYQK